MHGSPDWVRMVQVAVTVNNVPIIPDPAEEEGIDGYGSITTTLSSYQTVTSWTVAADKIGILIGVEAYCNDYTTAQWKLEVGGITIFEDITLPSALDKRFPEIHLDEGDTVVLSVKSDGSTSIDAYGDIDAKEVG